MPGHSTREHIDAALTVHVDRFNERRPAPRLASPLLADVTAEAPVVQVVNVLLTQALRDRASDVHVEPQPDVLRIRFRIDGALHDAAALPAVMAPSLVSRLKVMANLNIVERRRSQDGQFSFAADGLSADVRVSTIETVSGEKVVLRLLDKERSLLPLHDLGMDATTAERTRAIVRSPFGMVLVCGPTGAGKTTTLYAAILELDRTAKNVTTIEDPVEYVIDHASQVPINAAVGRTFATGLRAIVRQDPDIIVVGEVRDQETAEIAMNAALTGHLVLSSAHAIDGVGGIFRLFDLGVERYMVTSSLLAVLAQRLVRTLCTECRTGVEPTVAEAALLREAGIPAVERVWAARGCDRCSGTGYYGRVGVFELLILDEQLRAAVNAGASGQELRRIARRQGVTDLRTAGLRKVAAGETTFREVLEALEGAL